MLVTVRVLMRPGSFVAVSFAARSARPVFFVCEGARDAEQAAAAR